MIADRSPYRLDIIDAHASALSKTQSAAMAKA